MKYKHKFRITATDINSDGEVKEITQVIVVIHDKFDYQGAKQQALDAIRRCGIGKVSMFIHAF